jgi:hypothetical protein
VTATDKLRRLASLFRASRHEGHAARPVQSGEAGSSSSTADPVGQAVRLPFAPKPVMRFDLAMPLAPRAASPQRKTKISFIVIVYRMPDQAKKTLYSLSTAYQRGVDSDDYEVIVVENRSDRLLGEQAATAYAGDFRYFLRDENLPTPVFAINFAAAQASGTHIAVMIDGARMVTPGVVNYMLAATSMSATAVIAVPGYHLGHELQQKAVLQGYDETSEAGLLNSIDWPRDGYRLFEVSCLSGSCMTGFFSPIGESNCICVSRQMFSALDGYDIRFTETGGGQVNLDFYKRAVERAEAQLIILLGEGNFHQLHGGVTTESKGEQRHRAMQAHFAQYQGLRGEPYCPPDKRPIFLGAVPDAALKFIRHGANKVILMNEL